VAVVGAGVEATVGVGVWFGLFVGLIVCVGWAFGVGVGVAM
jgi:hypothetical protein